MPLLVSLQNTVQGFLVSEGRTWGINQAAGIGVIVVRRGDKIEPMLPAWERSWALSWGLVIYFIVGTIEVPTIEIAD